MDARTVCVTRGRDFPVTRAVPACSAERAEATAERVMPDLPADGYRVTVGPAAVEGACAGCGGPVTVPRSPDETTLGLMQA
ncbi:hypothetical protein HNR25_001465 [Streptomonospora salina]|uniref:Uncharacterized protein n=1 Tax=Streptomonospora salina TaxID=104205 RepID=A0A841E5I8_9ACTN|nr:hypothetical protein [Streptomonospora salina]